MWVRSQIQRTLAMHKTLTETIPRNIMNSGRVLSADNEAKLRAASASINDVLSQLGDENSGMLNFANTPLYPGTLRVSQLSPSEAEVLIYGDIGGWWEDGVDAKSFAETLMNIKADTIHARISSGGGVVYEGLSIYSSLASHPAKVIAYIEGIAASISAVIPMAADEIKIYEGSRMMIHRPWSLSVGNQDNHMEESKILAGLTTDLSGLFEARTGQNHDAVMSWLRGEVDGNGKIVTDGTWFSAQDAVKYGFADEMIPAKQKMKTAKSAMMKLYRGAPQDMQQGSNLAIREIESILRDHGIASKSQAITIASLAVKAVSQASHSDYGQQVRRDAGWTDACLEIKTIINQITKEKNNA